MDGNQDYQLADEIVALLRLFIISSRQQGVYHKPMPRINSHHFHALYALQYGNGQEITMSGLAEELVISKQQASKLVNTLEEKGLVYRLHDEVNRRQVYVRITQAGSAWLTQTLEDIRQWMSVETRTLDHQEQKRLHESVSIMREFIEKRLNYNQEQRQLQEEVL